MKKQNPCHDSKVLQYPSYLPVISPTRCVKFPEKWKAVDRESSEAVGRNEATLLLMEEILHHLGYINLVNNGIHYISTGAGFLPSTVSQEVKETTIKTQMLTPWDWNIFAQHEWLKFLGSMYVNITIDHGS